MTSTDTWTTRHEINFIKKIGTGKFGDSWAVKSRRRADLLLGYIKAAEQRTSWGSIDKDKALECAAECLRNELSN